MELEQHIIETELFYSLNLMGHISHCFQHLQFSLVLWKTEIKVLQEI